MHVRVAVQTQRTEIGIRIGARPNNAIPLLLLTRRPRIYKRRIFFFEFTVNIVVPSLGKR